MTVSELGQRMTFTEFRYWLAFYGIENKEREDRAAGRKPPMSDDEMLNTVKSLNTLFGGKVVEA